MSDTILTGAGQADTGQNAPAGDAPVVDDKFYDWTAQVKKEHLIEDLKGKKTPTDFIQHYQGVKKELETVKASIDGYVKVPGEGATPEEIAAYRAKTGVPESADKYEFKADKLPEGVTFDEQAIEDFKKIAFENGLTQGQADKILALDIERKGKAYQAFQEAKKAKAEEGLKLLKEKHGDKFNEKIIHAMRLVKKIGGDELEAELNEGMGNNPALVNMLMTVSQAFTEDGLVKGASSADDKVDLDEVYAKSMSHL